MKELRARMPFLNEADAGTWGQLQGGPFHSFPVGVGWDFGADFGVFPLKLWMEGNDSLGWPHWSHGAN
jgi:hypothetical protein